MSKASWGIVGMGVMGTALSRNLARNGLRLALYNRFVKNQEEQVAAKKMEQYDELQQAQAFENVASFIIAIERPRKIVMMISAGPGIDAFINKMLPYLEPNDILIDAGNSHFEHSIDRSKYLSKKGIHFLSLGVSGGEEGALVGPSLMASGNLNAYNSIASTLKKIAAKNSENKPCCVYSNGDGSGHFIKMVHNGVEYAEMQLLAECYDFMKIELGMANEAISTLFYEWDRTSSKNYLLKISSIILKTKNDKGAIIDQILDQASNKGTGKWATTAGTDLGIAIPMIATALQSRFISSFKKQRVELSKHFDLDIPDQQNVESATKSLKRVYDFCRLMNHHQGFLFIKSAAETYNWEIDLAGVAQAWTAGCIIKSDLMEEFSSHFRSHDQILIMPFFNQWLNTHKAVLKEDFRSLLSQNIPMSTCFAAWHYFLGITQKESSANLIQAQRDFFGTHGFLWKENPEKGISHGPWHENN